MRKRRKKNEVRARGRAGRRWLLTDREGRSVRIALRNRIASHAGGHGGVGREVRGRGAGGWFGIEGDSNPGCAAPLVRSSGDGHQVRFHGPCAALHFDCPTYRYSTSAIPVYYSLRPMVTGTTVYPLMICYSVFDVCCGNRPMSSPPPRRSPVSSNLSPCAVCTLYRSHPSSIISMMLPRTDIRPRFLSKKTNGLKIINEYFEVIPYFSNYF